MNLKHAYRYTDFGVMKYLIDRDGDINREYEYYRPQGYQGYSELHITPRHDSKLCLTVLSICLAENNHEGYRFLLGEYKIYILKIKMVLKYLGLDNIYFVTREIIESDIMDFELTKVVYS